MTHAKSPFPTILGLAAVIFALDQATKFLVVKNIPQNESWSLWHALDRLFKFTFITNSGAAFGIFPELGNVFTLIALLVIFAIIAFHHYLPTGNFWVRVSLGLQLGGAMGNVLDRLTRCEVVDFIKKCYVVDFIKIGFWPIFNIADLAIVMGVTILAYYLWDEEKVSNQMKDDSRLSEGGNL